MTRSLVPFGTRFPSLFDDFRREMDGLMNRFFRGEANGGTELAHWFSPQANVAESDGEYEITVDLPGLKPEDFNIELKHGELWITGERRHEEEKREQTWHRIERRYGRFQKVIPVGGDVDPEKVNAEYRDGVLRVTVPKTEEAKPKKIAVKA